MKYIKTLTKTIIVGAILFILVRNIASNFDQLKSLKQNFSYIYVAVSLFFCLLAWLLTSWSFGRTLLIFGGKLKFQDIFVIYFRSLPGRYLPGKIWQIMGSTYLAKKKGIPETSSITASIVAQAYSVLSGLMLFGLALIFKLVGGTGIIAQIRWTAIPLIVLLCVLALKPNLLEPILNKALRFLRKEKIGIKMPFSKTIELFALYFICWLLFGLAFWFQIKAFTDIGLTSYFSLTAILAAATTVGFLAVFAPGGLGVREGIIVLFLSPIFVLPLPSAIALGFRITMTISELVAFSLTWLINRSKNARKKQDLEILKLSENQ